MEFEKEELINLLCGKEIGSGIHRNVFECKLNEKWVVKVANQDGRQANLMEAKIWDEIQYISYSKWFAPVIAISEAGKFLIMAKAEIGRKKDYPKKVPHFFTDIKQENYGFIKNKLVCIDYASTIISTNWKNKLKSVFWDR